MTKKATDFPLMFSFSNISLLLGKPDGFLALYVE